jgi:hypothetical protein
MITEHPAITKGYVERGETITGSDGIRRIKYVIHHSRDYEIVVSVDKEQEFLDEEDRYGTEMAASKARMDAAQAKYAAQNAEKERAKAAKEAEKAALLPPPSKETEEVKKIFVHVLEGMKKEAGERLTAHYNSLAEQAKEIAGTPKDNEYRLVLKKWGTHVRGYDIPSEDSRFVNSILVHEYGLKDVTLIPEDKIKTKVAALVAEEIKAMFESFIRKQTDKVSGIIKGRRYHVKSRVCANLEGWFSFELADGAKFDMQTQIVWKYSPKGKRFWQFPTTFHNAVKADGTVIKTPSEAKLKKEL